MGHRPRKWVEELRMARQRMAEVTRRGLTCSIGELVEAFTDLVRAYQRYSGMTDLFQTYADEQASVLPPEAAAKTRREIEKLQREIAATDRAFGAWMKEIAGLLEARGTLAQSMIEVVPEIMTLADRLREDPGIDLGKFEPLRPLLQETSPDTMDHLRAYLAEERQLAMSAAKEAENAAREFFERAERRGDPQTEAEQPEEPRG